MRGRLVLASVLLLAFAVVPLTAGKNEAPAIDIDSWSQGDKGARMDGLAAALQQLKGDDSRYLARAGHLLLRAGDEEGARDLFSQSVDSDPKDDEAWSIIGIAYTEAGMWAEADEWFQKAVDKDPKDADHRVEWGVSLWKRGDKDKAIEMFTLGLNESPKSARLYYKIGRSID